MRTIALLATIAAAGCQGGLPPPTSRNIDPVLQVCLDRAGVRNSDISGRTITITPEQKARIDSCLRRG